MTFGEYEELNHSFLRLRLSGETSKSKHKEKQFHTPKLLPLLQKLLSLSVLVGSSQFTSAANIARHLVKIYTYLPTLHHRKLLISTLESPILQMYLARYILEEQCSGIPPRSYNCPTLDDLLGCYSLCHPCSTSHLTPPLTPNIDDSPAQNQHYPEESCEELALLYTTVIEAYIKTMKGYGTAHKGHGLSECDRVCLSNLAPDIDIFSDHIDGFSQVPLLAVQLHLDRLRCLAETSSSHSSYDQS